MENSYRFGEPFNDSQPRAQPLRQQTKADVRRPCENFGTVPATAVQWWQRLCKKCDVVLPKAAAATIEVRARDHSDGRGPICIGRRIHVQVLVKSAKISMRLVVQHVLDQKGVQNVVVATFELVQELTTVGKAEAYNLANNPITVGPCEHSRLSIYEEPRRAIEGRGTRKANKVRRLVRQMVEKI
jgi:hypothetical protein